MYVEHTSTGFALHDLTAEQMELLEEGLVHLQNALPKGPEFRKQRHDCADMFVKMDVELVNIRENADCSNG